MSLLVRKAARFTTSGLNVRWVPIDTVVPAIEQGEKEALGARRLSRLIQHSGRFDAIEVMDGGDGKLYVEDGNTRLAAAHILGMTEVPVGDIETGTTKTSKQHENASTQINVPSSVAQEIVRIGQKLIPDEYLAGEGRVTNPHVTVKYGVQPNEQALRQAIAGRGSFPIMLGKTQVFVSSENNAGGIPVVVEVHAHELTSLHKLVGDSIGALPDTLPYIPHITVAYVKPEEAQHFAGSDAFDGISFSARAVTLSMFDDNNHVDVPLESALPITAAAPAVTPEIQKPQAEIPGQVERDEPATQPEQEQGRNPAAQDVEDEEEEEPQPQVRKRDYSPGSKFPLPEQTDMPRDRRDEEQRPVTNTKPFKKWFGNSKVVDEEGNPMVVYHGTTHDIKEFDTSVGNIDNHYGRGMYFTDSKLDVAANYATNEGPDITNRIEILYDQIKNQMLDEGGLSEEDEEKLDDLAMERAKEQILGEHGGATVPVYISMQNPVIVQKRGGTMFEMQFDEETEDETGTAVELWKAVNSVAAEWGMDGQEIWNQVAGNLGSEFDAYDFEEQIRRNDRIEDSDGNMAQGEFIQQIYAAAGFDGIIQDAYAAFGAGQRGRPMQMDYDTKHYIPFNPSQVKSALGAKKFDPKSPKLTAAVKRKVVTTPLPKYLTDDGFVTPNGQWIDCSNTDHDTVARRLGYKDDYEPRREAVDDGYVRVVIWMAQQEAIFMFKDPANANRWMPELLKHLPVTNENVGVEEGRGKYNGYELAEAEEKWIGGYHTAAGEKSVGDLGLARNIMHELMPVLGGQLPEPELKIFNQQRARRMGVCFWNVGVENSRLYYDDNTRIEVQKVLLNDERSLRRILAHELCHHADNLINGKALIEKYQGTGRRGYDLVMRWMKSDAHGTGWKSYAQKFNAKYGADFVTATSDESYATEPQNVKPYYMALWRQQSGKIYYAVASRLGSKALWHLRHKLEDQTERLLMTTDPRFVRGGATIGQGWTVLDKSEVQLQAALGELWEIAGNQQVDLPNPWNEKDEYLTDPKYHKEMLEREGKEVVITPLNTHKPGTHPSTARDMYNVRWRYKTGAVPQIDELEHGVSKDYDRVRWVYQYFYDNQIQTMSWKDFQKTFQWATNSPLFTQVRQNRPQITLEDLNRWMEEYREKAKDYQNYELEYGKYRDKDTSFRDVEQLVLKINQSASAAEIIGEDPAMKFFLQQVAQGSVQSGHPVSATTVGWLRVDFVNDQWLLIDEVQSDLINAVDLAKRFITEPNLETLMNGYRSETVKQKIRDMGATEQMFQHSKQQFAQHGYTMEKLDEMRASLENLFKDWAEYGVASLIEIARRQGIKNVAIHTGKSIAQRDPELEADKAGRYYDQIAKAFGFKKQPLDIGDLKGEFWVRTAKAQSNLWVFTAGIRDQAITSATVGMDSFGFPTPVLIRWEQGMRWRQVLKAIKAVVGEIVGKRVAWRDIYLWASLWENREEQDKGWEEQKSMGKVMFDILHNGSFVSVGAPYRDTPYKNGEPPAEMVGYTDKEADGHKVTPLDETYYVNPEIGQETNAYADIPERVRGEYDVPSLDTLLGKTSAEVIRYTLDIHDSHRGELFGKVEALSGEEPVGYVQFSEADADIDVSNTRYWTEEQDEYGGQQWARADDYPREVHIKYVYVNPEYRRKGVGTGMYQKIKQEFPGEKIVSSGTTDEGGKFRNKLLERGVLSKLKSAGPQGAGMTQHMTTPAYGMSKALKNDPFAVEREELALSMGENRPAANPAMAIEDGARRSEGNGGGGLSPNSDIQQHLSAFDKNFGKWDMPAAQFVLKKLNAIPGAKYELRGSLKTKGESHNDLDLWGGNNDDELYDHEKAFEVLAKMGFEFVGNTDHGETWHQPTSNQYLDLWFEVEPDENFGKQATKIAKTIGPVYHGTGEQFEEYHTTRGLYYFTVDPDYADLFTNRVAPGKTLEGANIRRAYLTIDHPFDATGWGLDPLTIDDMVEILSMEPDETLGYSVYQGSMPFWQWVRNYSVRIKGILREQGYDSIIQKEDHPSAGYASATAYIVFNTNQIKWTMAKEQ